MKIEDALYHPRRHLLSKQTCNVVLRYLRTPRCRSLLATSAGIYRLRATIADRSIRHHQTLFSCRKELMKDRLNLKASWTLRNLLCRSWTVQVSMMADGLGRVFYVYTAVSHFHWPPASALCSCMSCVRTQEQTDEHLGPGSINDRSSGTPSRSTR